MSQEIVNAKDILLGLILFLMGLMYSMIWVSLYDSLIMAEKKIGFFFLRESNVLVHIASVDIHRKASYNRDENANISDL